MGSLKRSPPRGVVMVFRFTTLCVLLVMISARVARADRPIVQLTCQPNRFLSDEKCVGNLMLRELQRQAVLIAAREELGSATRDVVIGEPFAADEPGHISTLVFESQIWSQDKARMWLSRPVGKTPIDFSVLSRLKKGAPQDPRPPAPADHAWVDFPISDDPLVDYPQFVERCEAESRGGYLDLLRKQNVLGNQPPAPTAWVTTGEADPVAIALLQHLDVFSQYQAIRAIHSQIRTQGASTERIEALVRGYGNLNQLTENQWSLANKAFAARAMLYAQRLVVHEHSSPTSLYVRGYARALASLHGAALEDLNTADRATGDKDRPAWEPVIRAYCSLDLDANEQNARAGAVPYRPLATFLNALVCFDDYPKYRQSEWINRALAKNPAAFVLRTYASQMLENDGNPEPFQFNGNDINAITDHILTQLPILAMESLRDADLPSPVKAALGKVVANADGFSELAEFRDSLNDAATKQPRDTREPSLGVLADLIEQQEFAGVVRQSITFHSGVGGLPGVQTFSSKAAPIVSVHPWGAYVEAQGIDSNNDAEKINKTLDKIKPREFGGWVEQALRDLTIGEPEKQTLTTRWQTPSNLSLDNDFDDYSDDTAEPKWKKIGQENYLWRLRKTSPHAASLMDSWLKAMQPERIVNEQPLYESAMSLVETEFADRPQVVVSASDWCNRRADFARSLKMLRRIDQIDSTDDICFRIAQLCRKLGYREPSEAYLIRGAQLSADGGQTDNLYQRLAEYLIEDQQYDRALNYVQKSGDGPTARSWQLTARCFEHLGRLDDAADCLSQQATADPLAIEQYYLWAQRVGRKNVNEIGRKAAAAFATPNDDYQKSFYMLLGQDEDRKALELLQKNLEQNSNAMDYSEAITLALTLKDTATAAQLLKKMPDTAGDADPQFGVAMKALADAGDVDAGTRAFDEWVSRQLDAENAVDWYSAAGRYLVAAGHPEQGRRYLQKANDEPSRERESYFFAWRELKRLDSRGG